VSSIWEAGTGWGLPGGGGGGGGTSSPSLAWPGVAFGVPVLSGWTQVNWGGSTTLALMEDSKGYVFSTTEAGAVNFQAIRDPAAWSSGNTLTACFQVDHNGTNAATGIFVASASGQLVLLSAVGSGDGPSNFTQRFNSPTSFSATLATATRRRIGPLGLVWLRIVDNGTNLLLQTSYNGYTWETITTEGRAAFLTDGPVSCGIATQIGTSGVLAQSAIVHAARS